MEKTLNHAPDDPPSVLTVGTDAWWLGELLRERGHQVAQHESVMGALQAIATEDPDLIVIDAGLPMDGTITLCRALRVRADDDRPVVVASQGALGMERRSDLLLAGAWECVAPAPDGRQMELVTRLETFMRARRTTGRDRHDSLTDPSTGLYSRVGLSRRARELGAHLFRTHDSLACVVIALTIRPDSEAAMVFCTRILMEEGRISDVMARLADREIAILAPRTDAPGAVRLAERLGRTLRDQVGLPGAEGLHVELHGAYEAVPDLGYAPVQPIDLVVRTAAVLRAAPPPTADRWLEVSGPHRAVTGPT